jgi:hypothetical protein
MNPIVLLLSVWVPSLASQLKRLKDEHKKCKLPHVEITKQDELDTTNNTS